MLEPRSASGRGTSSAMVTTSSSIRASSAPPLSPWPRWSNATAVMPAARPPFSQPPRAARSAALAVAARVERPRRDAGRARLAGVVEVALLRRAGAVEDHHPAARLARRAEERVGQPVALAQLGRRLGRGPVDAAVEQVEQAYPGIMARRWL